MLFLQPVKRARIRIPNKVVGFVKIRKKKFCWIRSRKKKVFQDGSKHAWKKPTINIDESTSQDQNKIVLCSP